jgi:hypothetical protein
MRGRQKTQIDPISLGSIETNRCINEFWTAKQRDACSIHEISYRACFKPQLPRFFIDRFTTQDDTVYVPFGGRGTTIIETALSRRYGISNDINPLSKIFAYPRLHPPFLVDVVKRLAEIQPDDTKISDIDLSMFYHSKTLGELASLREYLYHQQMGNTEDDIDRWIRMIATNRLTGHLFGFFLSILSLPIKLYVLIVRLRSTSNVIRH